MMKFNNKNETKIVKIVDFIFFFFSVLVRGSIGISLGQGPPSYEPVKSFPKDDSKTCKAMVFSPDGRYFAWANGVAVKILYCNTWKIIIEIKRPKISAIKFSSQGTYFMTWEPFIGIMLLLLF